jgi:hypothetical protein
MKWFGEGLCPPHVYETSNPKGQCFQYIIVTCRGVPAICEAGNLCFKYIFKVLDTLDYSTTRLTSSRFLLPLNLK